MADTESDGLLRQRCRVCGGPRVVVDDKVVVRSGREIKPLERAQQARVRRALWLASSGVVGGFGVLSLAVTLLVLLVASPGVIGTLAMFGAAAIPLVVAALAWTRAKRHTRELETSLDQAWAFAAEDVLSDKGKDLTSTELAKILRVEEVDAEALLAQLSASDVVRSQVTEGGDVTYGATTKVRIDASESSAPMDDAEEANDEAAVRARARIDRES